jgi:hypothetical protein
MTYHGRTITETRIIGMRKLPTPFCYALFLNTGMTYSGKLTTGAAAANGDVYCNGALVLTGLGSVINGDLECSAAVSLGTATVTGNQNANITPLAFPTVVNTNYSTVANLTVAGGTIGTRTFPTTASQYYLIYSSANTNINGTFTGKGTIFVNGNVTINGAVLYGNATSRVAIIAKGSITFTTSAACNGLYYAGTSCSLPLGGITITKGSIVAGSLGTLLSPMTITNDTTAWTDITEGTKHRLPGLYP